MAGCDDGAATKRYVFSSGHQANLKMSTKTSVTLWCILYFIQRFFGVISLIRCCPTCQGYSLTSVSTLPTILVRLRATPQFHVEEEVAGVVDPEIGLEVVVEIVGRYTFLALNLVFFGPNLWPKLFLFWPKSLTFLAQIIVFLAQIKTFLAQITTFLVHF